MGLITYQFLNFNDSHRMDIASAVEMEELAQSQKINLRQPLLNGEQSVLIIIVTNNFYSA